MNSEIEIVFAEDPPAVVLGELEVATVRDGELPRAARLLEDEHYLGAARPVGRTLVQAVHHQGRWVALLFWGPAALKLAARDEAIGWTDSQRAERIGLIVPNRRFLVLGKTRMPNLASRALSLAVKALPGAWEQAHGYRPLLAETFTDIEQFEGTCYKAAAWQPCGITKGFTREHRADFFFRNARPKKLWLRVLHRQAGPLLCNIEMPPEYAAGLNRNSPERALPLRKAPRLAVQPRRHLPPRAELLRALQPALQNGSPWLRRGALRVAGRRPRHPAARTRRRWQIRAQPRADPLSERARERRARRHRHCRPGPRE